MHPVVDPYANKAHRKFCGCATCANTASQPACRRCMSWRRISAIAGTCWLHGTDITVVPDHACESFEPRAIFVEGQS